VYVGDPKEEEAPFAGLFEAFIVPQWALIIFWLLENPIPDPPGL
jgi:hypothetical protein